MISKAGGAPIIPTLLPTLEQPLSVAPPKETPPPSPSIVAVPESLLPLAEPPAKAGLYTPQTFGQVVRETAHDWAHEGKKLGALAGASVVCMQVPLQIALHAPSLAGVLLNPAGMIGAVVLGALEEHYIGVGKHLGAAVAGAAGAAVGTVKGAIREFHPEEPRDPHQKVQLPIQAPTGAPPREALLPSLLHRAERKLLGGVPERDRAVEIGEGIGVTVSTLAGAYILPGIVGAAIGGPVGMVMSSLAGPLLGLVAGGVAENALGVGRFAGELAGTAVSKLTRGKAKPESPAEAATPKPTGQAVAAAEKAGIGNAFKSAFLALNHVIAEPIMGFLVDAARITNRLFAEKPHQSIRFEDRPEPKVDRQRVIDNFVKLAGIDGKSGHEQAIGDEICRQLDALGISCERRPDGNIIGTVPGTVKDAPTVVLSAHQDTVSSTSAQSIRIDDRRISTDEKFILGSDDRAGIAQILEGVRVVLEEGRDHPEIKMVFTVGEESGLTGSSKLRPDDITKRPALGFVMDSTNIRDLNLTNDSVILNSQSVKYQFSQEEPLVQVVFRSMAEAGTEPRPIHAPIMAGAGSDANTPAFNSKNIRSIAVGTGMTDIHSGFENIKLDDVEQGARHVVGLITNSCDLKVDGDAIVARYSLP